MNLDADGGDFGADVEQLFDDEVKDPFGDRFSEKAGQEVDSDGDTLGAVGRWGSSVWLIIVSPG